MSKKLAFIGPSNIHNAFIGMDDTWDMQQPIESVRELMNELSPNNDSPKISRNTGIIIFFSRLFNEEPEEFAKVVAFLAPYTLCCILIPQQDLDKKQDIDSAIKNIQYQMTSNDENYNVNTPYYFCAYEDPQNDILIAVDNYLGSNAISEEVKESIRPFQAVDSTVRLEEYDKSVDDMIDRVVSEGVIDLPKAAPGATGKIITVTSSKGGSGKSTVSILLGAYIAKSTAISAQEGKIPFPLKVCIVDLDVRDGQLGILTGSMSPNIIDIMMTGKATQSNVERGIYKSEKLNCDFIFAARRPRNAKKIPATFYAEVIQTLRSMYDVIILDTSVNYLDELLNQVAYPLADRIVLVSDMGISSILGMKRWIMETVESPEDMSQEISKDKIGIVINKAMSDVNMSANKIQMAAGDIPVISMIPSAQKLITYAANTNALGEVLNEYAINQAIRNIATQVISTPLAEVPYIKR